MKLLAVIPARGGSKSIPDKNIVILAGRPLLAWTILAARSAHSVDRVIVTTDAPAIAEVAQGYGAEVPFLRPSELAQDDTPGIAPILHAVQWLRKHENYYPDWIMCLQPTSPLRTSQDIDTAVELALAKNADAVVSVMPAHHHPYWMKSVDSEGRMQNFMTPDRPVSRRQDLPPVYMLNGAIYLVRSDILLAQQSWYTDKTYAYAMPSERSLDIDSRWDLHLVDLILGDEASHASH